MRPCEDEACKHDDDSCAYVKSQKKIHSVFFATDDPVRYIAWGILSDAVEMCSNCPVSKECLEFAAMSPNSWKEGVYGGLLGSQRFFQRHSRTEANLERALEDQEFVLGRVRDGISPTRVADELKDLHRKKGEDVDGGD